jgi:hypothetical protein
MLQFPFRLSGKTSNLWRQITNNQWQNMLPKNWTDNGFHFYSRIKDRGPEAGINTPFDLQSEMMNGTVSLVNGIRYQVRTNIVNSTGQHFTIFYDFDARQKMCQLVTCSYA